MDKDAALLACFLLNLVDWDLIDKALKEEIRIRTGESCRSCFLVMGKQNLASGYRKRFRPRNRSPPYSAKADL